MDMKKILEAVDGAPKKPSQEDSTDMKKFLSIVVEGKDTTTNRLSMAEQMAVQHYQKVEEEQLQPKKDRPSIIKKYVEAVEQDQAQLDEELASNANALKNRIMEKMYPNAYFGKSGKMAKHLAHAKTPGASVMQSAKQSAQRMVGEGDEVDTVTMDVPLLIRLLEYSREDAKTDMDLHNVTEMLISLSKEYNVLSMDQYDAIVGNQKELPAPDSTD